MDRNLLLAIMLSAAVLLIWELTFGAQQREALEQARKAQQEATTPLTNDSNGNIVRDAGQLGGTETTNTFVSLNDALNNGEGRVPIETTALSGSINLRGGRFDDLVLKDYRETLDENSGNIHLLKPENVESGHFMEQGWLIDGKTTSNETWRLKSGDRLTPDTPIVLTRESNGLSFEKTISVDEHYLFTG